MIKIFKWDYEQDHGSHQFPAHHWGYVDSLDSDQMPSECDITEGVFLTTSELEQVARDAYFQGVDSERANVNDWSTDFNDYWSEKQKEQSNEKS